MNTEHKPNYTLLSAAAVTGVILASVCGGGLLAVAVKSAAGLVTWHSLRCAGRDFQRLRAAEVTAGLSGDKARLHELAIEVLAAAAGAAIFCLATPFPLAVACPLVVGAWLAYRHYRGRQLAQMQNGEA